jgi:glucosamine--fructose-6-phosphate aminotransferase (isomerizing)
MIIRESRAQPATYSEIRTQPRAWQQALEVVDEHARTLLDLWSEGSYGQVLFTGCGSTHYLALAAAALFQELTGTPARGVPAGELLMYPESVYPAAGRTLLVAISRSAETTETVRAAQTFCDEQDGEVIVVTNYGDRPLAQAGAIALAIPAGQEESIAQTGSFACMYVATTALAATLAGREDLVHAMTRLPSVGARLIPEYEPLAQSLGSDLSRDRFYFLGSGPRYGLACEASLKMKEMSLTHSEPFHFLEFRHGPKSMVGPSAMIAGLLSESNRAYESALLTEMHALGATVLSLGEEATPGGWPTDVPLASGLPEAVRNVLYLPVLQFVAYYRAIAKGLDPDRPHNLDAVVRLQGETTL